MKQQLQDENVDFYQNEQMSAIRSQNDFLNSEIQILRQNDEINKISIKELQDQKQQQFKRLSYLNEDLNNHMSRKLDPSDNFLAENLSPPNLSQSQNQELIYALNILNQSDKTDECKSKF